MHIHLFPNFWFILAITDLINWLNINLQYKPQMQLGTLKNY